MDWKAKTISNGNYLNINMDWDWDPFGAVWLGRV